ncbi:MAG: type II toxin-antitoxin system CcdA family antitoxin [Rhodopila sp.]
MNQATKRKDDGAKRATNVSLSEALVSEARELGINVSRACEDGLETEVRRERTKRWHEDNAAGFEAWNAYVERHGVPLARFRKF